MSRDILFWSPIHGFVGNDDRYYGWRVVSADQKDIIEDFSWINPPSSCFSCEHLCRLKTGEVNAIIFMKLDISDDPRYRQTWEAAILCMHNVSSFPGTIEEIRSIDKNTRYDGLIPQNVWWEPVNCPKEI